RGHRSAAVADALGWALHRSGDSDAAVEYAQRAVDSGGQNASYAYHLGMVRRAVNDYGPARRQLEAALRTNPKFSPLDAPLAREALDTLGEPPAGGPADMQPPPAPEPQAPQAPAPQAP
ncbi:tetratricopeptide repeat protein, partial [Streptomyces sp. SID9124]